MQVSAPPVKVILFSVCVVVVLWKCNLYALWKFSECNNLIFEFSVFRSVVLGGGLGGLSAAYYLTKCSSNVKVVVLEGSGRVGGWVR